MGCREEGLTTEQLWFSASGKFWIFDEGLDVN
jgi:hypothetical protein